jgi:hypothetical protein
MRKLALKRLRALNGEKKRFSAKLRMLRALLDNDFLYRICSESKRRRPDKSAHFPRCCHKICWDAPLPGLNRKS